MVFCIPGYLRPFTHGNARVELETAAATVNDVLGLLCAAHPGVRDRVLTEQGEVRPHVNLFVGAESIRFTGGLATPLPEGAEIWIVPAVSGG